LTPRETAFQPNGQAGRSLVKHEGTARYRAPDFNLKTVASRRYAIDTGIDFEVIPSNFARRQQKH
jgi:hypothetical protein